MWIAERIICDRESRVEQEKESKAQAQAQRDERVEKTFPF